MLQEDIFRGLYELPGWGIYLTVLSAGPIIMHILQFGNWVWHKFEGTKSPVSIWRFRAIIIGDPILAASVVAGSYIVKNNQTDIWADSYEASWLAAGLGLIITLVFVTWVAALGVRDIGALPGGITPIGVYHAFWFWGMASVLTDLLIKSVSLLAVAPKTLDFLNLIAGLAGFAAWLILGILDNRPPTWFGLYKEDERERSLGAA